MLPFELKINLYYINTNLEKMALLNVVNKLGKFGNTISLVKRASSTQVGYPVPDYREWIGNREVVGPSFTGREIYYDRKSIPCPPIRYKRPSPEMDALREKEKGDWKSLTIDEKKTLYRYSFCQTFAEFEAPTPEWKHIAGNVMFLISIPIFLYVLFRKTILPPLPDTLSDEGKKKVVRFYIDNAVDPIEGVASKWDYEKNEWKEKPFWFIRKK